MMMAPVAFLVAGFCVIVRIWSVEDFIFHGSDIKYLDITKIKIYRDSISTEIVGGGDFHPTSVRAAASSSRRGPLSFYRFSRRV
jgi:hypothetical protein